MYKVVRRRTKYDVRIRVKLHVGVRTQRTYACSTTGGSDVRLRTLLCAYELYVYARISTSTQTYPSTVVNVHLN